MSRKKQLIDTLEEFEVRNLSHLLESLYKIDKIAPVESEGFKK